MIVDRSSNGTFIYPDHGEPLSIHMAEHTLSGSGVIFFGQEKGEAQSHDAVFYAVREITTPP